MADASRYLEELVRDLGARPERVARLKARTLLGRFGYARRDAAAVAAVRQGLRAHGLSTDLSARQPASLEGRVEVRLAGHAPGPRSAARPWPARAAGAGSNPSAARRSGLAAAGSSMLAPVHEGTSSEALGWARAADRVAIAERALSATVTVACGDGHGAGVLVHEDGLVVTARHVVRDSSGYARQVEVRLRDGKSATGIVVRGHTPLDFALLWLDRKGPFATLPLGDTARLRAAEPVLAVGHPERFTNTVSGGMICNPRAVLGGVEYIQTDAALDHGNSGGPLLNAAGEVIGINVWEWGTLDSGKFALPVDYFADAVADVVSAGRRRCLSSRCCLSCGHLHLEAAPSTRFCRVCGSRQLASGA